MPEIFGIPLTAYIITAAAVLAAAAALWRYLHKARQVIRLAKSDAIKVRDSINGRPAIVDSITGEILAPPLPGIGKRMDSVERAVIALADQHIKLDDHEGRIKALEEARVERVITRAESTQAWSTMEAAIKADPPSDGKP